MFGLCDCNNFFASCERVFRPDLNGKPVVVLSNNDGCIIARSEEAKAIGITMGMPAFQAQGLVQKYGVTVFSGNYQLYGDMSQRVMSILRSRVPAIEVYSVDEAFLDMDNMRFGAGILPGTNEEIDAAEEFGRRLSAEIKLSTGIPVSIGLAPTKTLAKIDRNFARRTRRCVVAMPFARRNVWRCSLVSRSMTCGASAVAMALDCIRWDSTRLATFSACPR